MNLTYSNNFVRGTGDDAMAINSVHYNVNGSTTNYLHHHEQHHSYCQQYRHRALGRQVHGALRRGQ